MYSHITFVLALYKQQLCCWTVSDSGRWQKLKVLAAGVHWDQSSRSSPVLFCSLPLVHSSLSLKRVQLPTGDRVSLQLNLPSFVLSWSTSFPLTCSCFVFFLLHSQLSHSSLHYISLLFLSPLDDLKQSSLTKDD